MLANNGYRFLVSKAHEGKITSVWVTGLELPEDGISGTSVCHPQDTPVKEYGRWMAVLKAVKPLPHRLRKAIIEAYRATGVKLPNWEQVYRLNGKAKDIGGSVSC